MKSSPKVSVIIPNYNNAEYIVECLNSVLSQSVKSIEILVCDDDSSDDSREIIDRYQKFYPNITVIKNGENIGVTRSRHRAIKASTGRYITTLDSDDFYTSKRKLEKELKVVEKAYKSGRYVIAFSNIAIVDEASKCINNGKTNNIKDGFILEELLCRTCMIPRDFTFHRDMYFNVGGYELSRNLHEDWDLKIRLAKEYEYAYTGALGVSYRRRQGSLSDKKEEDLLESLVSVFEKNIGLVRAKYQDRCRDDFYSMINRRKRHA